MGSEKEEEPPKYKLHFNFITLHCEHRPLSGVSE